VDHLSLGETRLWVKDLIQVRYRKLLTLNDQLRFLGHVDPQITQKIFRAVELALACRFGRRNAPSFHGRSKSQFPRAKNKSALSVPLRADVACGRSLFPW